MAISSTLDWGEMEASISPITTWSFQTSTHDPAYLASQDELRTLLFTTARTPVQTRRSSPVDKEIEEPNEGSLEVVQQILATSRRLEILGNYIGCVAAWVSGRIL